MRVVHFELSCAAISGEPSVPLFCMFYRLISDGDWFTFAKRPNSVSRPCYNFMPTSTYPKDWKCRFIFVSAAMLPESPVPKDLDAAIEDVVPTLSASETVQWKRMCDNPTRAFTFSEGMLAMGGLSPSYPVRPRAFFGKKEITLWRLLQGDSKDVKYVVDDEVDPRLNAEVQVTGGFVQAGGSAALGGSEEDPSGGDESSPDLPPVHPSGQSDDEEVEIQLVRKRRSASPQPAPAPPNIRQRLRSASGQKLPPSSKAVSDLPPAGGSSREPIEIPTGPSPSRIRDKTSEVGVARFSSAYELSSLHATGTSKPTFQEALACRSPLAPLFADAIPSTYVPKWKVTSSSVIGTPEAARDFLSHAVPPSHKFVNSALRDDLFEDQYSMSLCESFFRGAGMLQRIDDLRKANEGLKAELKASQLVVAGLRGQVVDAERRLQEEKGAGAMLERKERAWEQEMASLIAEKEELAAELKHVREVGSVSQEQLNTMYADYGITSDDNQRLAGEKHWLITEGFGAFLTAVAQSEDFKSGLEEVYRAYRNVGYQAGLKDGYVYSAQGLGRKETPLYNSKAKKRLSKLNEEFGRKTPAILAKILEHPLISIDELKALFSSAGPSSPPSLSGGDPQ
ncbi:hypothetical protein HanXRQr2_Chr04g0151861 [Helianthus annuus]|uniref:Transposase (Putative), gypsy type n=1 Tax=Helianthus annuus TaxID=4232 RepID=A0A9K3J6V8_HELAN|nr:hypothetical protein HanXRQr2_Chr04g0151861 [Helianthus annuus]KAJ0930169.1 hypothetical protein HanPSC8_Chr04g0146231 [Helianthus annuus]